MAPAAVLGGPVEAHGEAELVELTGGLAVEREVAHAAGAAAVHLLFEAGMRHDETTAIQHVVADERVQEGGDAVPELGRLGFKLGEGLGEAVVDLHIGATQLAKQLHIVIAGNAEAGARGDHGHNEAQDVRRAGTTVHEIAEEHRLASVWV